MSLTINLPPAMETEARGYRMLEGKTLEQMFLDYLKKEFERRRTAQKLGRNGKPVKIRDLEPDPRLRGSVSDADLFSDDTDLWNACHDESGMPFVVQLKPETRHSAFGVAHKYASAAGRALEDQGGAWRRASQRKRGAHA